MKLILLTFTLLLLPISAFAYIDPGTGMLLWQGLIAAVGAIIITVRNPMQAVKALIRRFRGLKTPGADISPQQDEQTKSNINSHK